MVDTRLSARAGKPPSQPPTPSPGLVTPVLPLNRYELTFRAVEPVRLAPMAASLWRGVLGRALKLMADGEAPAPRELAADQARTLYRDLFETPPPPDAAKMRRYQSVPHAYTLYSGDGDSAIAAGESTILAMTLIGHANRALPGILAGFRRAAETGIGKSRGRMALNRVEAVWRLPPMETETVFTAGGSVIVPRQQNPLLPPMPRFVEIRLLSPLRLLHQGRLAGPDDFRARDMLGFLVRRVSMLSTFHTDHPLETDFRQLKEIAAGARIVERNLAWARQARWSGTRKEEIPMDGLAGWFVLDLQGQEALWPYLWLAPWIHAGKGATGGQGAVALRPA